MGNFDPGLERELERWRVAHEVPDWADVVRRAAGGRRREPRRVRRLYVALAAVAALGLAAPAFALLARQLFTSRPAPGTFSTVSVNLNRGQAILWLRSLGSPITRTARGFRYVEGDPNPSRTFIWRLKLSDVDRLADIAFSLKDGAVVPVCSPCANGRHGSFVLHSTAALELLNGQATIRVGRRASRVAPAAGGRLRD